VREIVDDANSIQPDDLSILIVDNDHGFADFAIETARRVGFKALVAGSGSAGIALARDFKPAAILLDISLPDFDGWRVLQRLKRDLSVRHIPVFVVSTIDDPEYGFKLGAKGILRKPIPTADALEHFLHRVRTFVERGKRRAIVVDSDDQRRESVARLLAGPQIEVVPVETGSAAIEAFDVDAVDCVVLTPDPEDMSLASLAEQLLSRSGDDRCPLLLLVDSEASEERRQRLSRLATEFNLQLVEDLDVLSDQAAVALRQSIESLPEERQRKSRERFGSANVLAGKKVLIVDDDIRNIFALTSVLERHDVVTVSAETGRDAINLLQASPDVSIVLMDIMMPEMDGNDTMRAIRAIPRFKDLPIIAVTAKAMKGDREKCFEAGAWDYLSKPVDPEQMLASLCAWLTT
jgi:CheY-like chemotaxis protein